MKYKVLYHHTGGFTKFAGVEIQPPLEDKEATKNLAQRVRRRLNVSDVPQRLRGVVYFYCNGGSSEGTHFLAMPNEGVKFKDTGPAQRVASYVGMLLRRDGHEVTVAHEPEWDGEIMGSRDEVPLPMAEATADLALQPEPPSEV